jgi:hypothetical protein
MIDPNGLFGGLIGIGISMAIGMGNQSRGTAANLGVYYRIYNQFVTTHRFKRCCYWNV